MQDINIGFEKTVEGNYEFGIVAFDNIQKIYTMSKTTTEAYNVLVATRISIFSVPSNKLALYQKVPNPEP